MFTFLKANVASIIASLCDYVLTIILAHSFGINIVYASGAGIIFGGIVNFMVGRHWVFGASGEKVHRQAGKYAIVWAGNLILNMSGVYVFTQIFKIHYAVSKLLVSLIVAFGYNYPFQKKFVYIKSIAQYND